MTIQLLYSMDPVELKPNSLWTKWQAMSLYGNNFLQNSELVYIVEVPILPECNISVMQWDFCINRLAG